MKCADTIKHQNFAAIILAGGASSRMGEPKPWMKFGDGTTFLHQSANCFIEAGLGEIAVVLNSRFYKPKWEQEIQSLPTDVFIILNEHPEHGRLYSVWLGLSEIKSEFVFIHNVDNPFITSKTIKALMPHAEKNTAVIPSFQGKGGHPVLIGNSIKNEIQEHYRQYQSLKNVFDRFTKKYVELNEPSVLINLNTPSDYRRAIHELV